MRFMERRRGIIRIIAERFALFSRTVLEASKILGVPQVFHCHDWQSALVAGAAAHALRGGSSLPRRRNGLHHPQYGVSGIVSAGNFGRCSCCRGSVHHVEDGIFWTGKFSEGCAHLFRLRHDREPEIQPGNSDCRIWLWAGGVLRDRAADRDGILNGVDYDEWSPQADKFIAAKYSPQDLAGKAKCKQDLLAAFGVKDADPKLPVIGIVSRFAAQKGFDLIRADHGPAGARRDDCGRSGAGDKPYEEMFVRLNKQFPTRSR